MRAGLVIWSLIALMALLAVALYPMEDMSVAVNYHGIGLFLAVLVALAGATRRRYPAASHIAHTVVQLIVLSRAGAYLSYVAMAMTPFPLADTTLAQADAVFGFDWRAWFFWIHGHTVLHDVLALAYQSIPLQLLVLIVYFAFREADRLDELTLGAIITIVLTMPGMIFLPAVGAWSEHAIGTTEPWKHDILALRAHQLLIVEKTQGIISFPSFHAASAILLVNMARRCSFFMPVLLLNMLMIASVLSEGAHYFVDMLGGVVVALVAIAITHGILNLCRNGPAGVSGADSWRYRRHGRASVGALSQGIFVAAARICQK
jgi:membrane-associated phospholipid phosphatase